MRRILSILALTLCLALICPAAAGAEAGVTVNDMAGREITLDAPATRVVALSAADCEILYALGAGDALVGRGTYCDYPAEVLEVSEVQSGYDANLELILALRPQLVLMSAMAQTKEQVAALEDAGIAVAVSFAEDIEGTYESILMIGALLGKDAEAETLVASMRDGFSEIAERATGDGQETVYFETSPLQYGLWTGGRNTFMNELAAMLGLKNAFDDVEGWATISEEQVLERNPDFIVAVSMYAEEGPAYVEEITSREGWAELKAVKNGRVFNANSDEITRPGPRLLDAAKALFGFVYGE